MVKLIATGAAGGKAVINAIEKGIITKSMSLILNTTLKDVPTEYREIAIEFGAVRGCGKERNIASEECLNALKDDKLKALDTFFDPNDDTVIIVSSSEGGTGSGSSKILGEYAHKVLGLNVKYFVFVGFENDIRGLQNTIEYFQDIQEFASVEAISNKKFLEGSTNYIKAEKLANDEFASKLAIYLGKDIIESDQNIDETDLYKVISTPGYMITGKAYFSSKIKNIDQFNKILADMIDNDKSLDTDKSMRRLAVFLNISEETKDNIDFSFSTLKDKLGVPYEVFVHIQNVQGGEYISFIASGLNLPLDEVKDVYQKYKEESEKVNKKKDAFFGEASSLKGNDEDAIFNSAITRKRVISKDEFFNSAKETSNSIDKF